MQDSIRIAKSKRCILKRIQKGVSVKVLNRKETWKYILISCIALVLSLLLTYVSLGKMTFSEPQQLQTITIRPLEEKSADSWGNELRFYHVRINQEYIDLQELAKTQGWSYENQFLFFSGQGEELRISCNEQVKDIEVFYCKQNGSGKVSIWYNDENLLGILDLYNENWVKETFNVSLLDTVSVVKSIVWFFLFGIILLFLAMRCMQKGQEEAQVRKIGLGAFDLAKGVGILLVVVGHVAGYFNSNPENMMTGGAAIWGALIQLGLMPMFFFISGYGLKKKKNRECIKSHIDNLFKPYYKVAAVCCVLIIPITYFIGDDIWQRLRATSLSFLLCNFKGAYLGSVFVDGNNPVWFLWALAIAGILMNLILKLPKKVQKVAVAIAAIGYGFAMEWIGSGWAIFEVLFAIVAMYAGHLLKQEKILETNKRSKGILILLSGVAMVMYCIPIENPVYEQTTYILGRLAAGLLLVLLFNQLNRVENKFLDMIRMVGRYTYWILCIHTVELACIPFYLLTGAMMEHRVLAAIIVITIMIALIVIGCYVLRKIASWKYRRKKKKNAR